MQTGTAQNKLDRELQETKAKGKEMILFGYVITIEKDKPKVIEKTSSWKPLKPAPMVVMHRGMRRDWWIFNRWETDLTGSEPVYKKIGLRPIQESTKAASEFDETWRNREGQLVFGESDDK